MNEIVQRSGKATASMVLGILSFCLTIVTGIPAIILGILALMDIGKSEGETSGRGMAIAGIATGGIGSVLMLPVMGIMLALLLPAVNAAREAARKSQCKNLMKQMGLSLQVYEAQYGSLPPAYLADDGGTPMHSWRLLLTPSLERNDLYDAYDFDEPWNGRTNAPLAQQMPQDYACPSDAANDGTLTSYVAVTGPGFVFDGAKAVRFRDVLDGTSYTIALVELANSGIPWTEPRDMTFDDFVLRVQDRSVSDHIGGFNAVFVDGSTQFISYDGLDRETLKALFTIAGNEPVMPQR